MTPSQKRKCRAREDAIVGVYDEYALKGGVGKAVGLDKDEIEARIENAWFCCRVDRKELKRLITRRDGPALRHFGLWAVLLSGSGALAFLAWPSPWCIPAFLAYGVLYSVSDHHSHELSHGTVFRTRWINEVLLRVAGFMTLHESYYWRWSHARHHTETIIVGRDPEIAFPRPPDSGALLDFFFIKSGIQQIHNIVTHAFGTLKPSAEEFIPEAERKKVVRVSRAYTAVFIAVIAACVATASVLPALFSRAAAFLRGLCGPDVQHDTACGLGRERPRPPAQFAHRAARSGFKVPLHEHELPHRAPHVPDGAFPCAPQGPRADQGSMPAALQGAHRRLSRDHTGAPSPAPRFHPSRGAPVARPGGERLKRQPEEWCGGCQ